MTRLHGCDPSRASKHPCESLLTVGTPLPTGRTTTFNRRWRMEARITAQSQSFKLRERLEEAKVSHGQEVRADLLNARVSVNGSIHVAVDRETLVVSRPRPNLERIPEIYFDNWPRAVGIA